MNLKAALKKGHSKAISEQIADYIGNDPEKFEQLIVLFLGSEYRIAQRAAMAISHTADRHIDLIKPHLAQFITILEENPPVAIKRNVVRLLQKVELPKNLQGRCVNCCFNLLTDTKEAIAVKVFSMTVIYNISKEEPDLQRELRLVLEDQLEHGSAGFRNRAGKILAKIN